ncbi:hypothetical protein P4O66_008606 [Electrophorus voltai]|uniref:G-protein coupled receptors family 1 profile domain-containing protein n=1 Tax=Electrophorus voltai TaxID=2609070 RepID=A0AAD8ZGQ2_9TELE|nr:hypothetical protein P4O66_008606 [Electrophorus voltai]
MMGTPGGAVLVGFGSTTSSLDVNGWMMWPGNTTISLNQSLFWSNTSTNASSSSTSMQESIKEKNWPALLILVIIVLTVGGNILVILAVSLEKKLQNATNFFLRSLAVADMLVGILVMPISLINILYEEHPLLRTATQGSGLPPRAPDCHPGLRTATHCSGLPPTAPDCHPGLRTATQGSGLPPTAPDCHPLLRTATQGSGLPPTAPDCHPLLRTATQGSGLPPRAPDCHPLLRTATHCSGLPPRAPDCHPGLRTATQGSGLPPTAPDCHPLLRTATQGSGLPPTAPDCHPGLRTATQGSGLPPRLLGWTLLAEDYAWPLPDALCPIWIYLDVLFSTASIMHLCAISLDRYVAICNPIQHSRFNSRTKAMLKIAAVWTISIGISTPIPVIGLRNKDKVFVSGSCVLNEERFVLVGSFVAFFIPLVIMVVTYCLTVQALQRQASVFLYEAKASSQQPLQPQAPPTSHLAPPPAPSRRSSLNCLRVMGGDGNSLSPAALSDSISIVASSETPSQLSSPAGRDPGGAHGRRGMMQAIKNERRASKVLGVVFFLFLLMWCPFFITNVLSVLCREACDEPLLSELLNVFVWVGYISSGVNPLVYTLFNKTYRRAFSSYMRCRYKGVRLKPIPIHVPCPSHSTVTPLLICGKASVDRNSNCRNGGRNGIRNLEPPDTDTELRLEMQPGLAVNSCHALAELTSTV